MESKYAWQIIEQHELDRRVRALVMEYHTKRQLTPNRVQLEREVAEIRLISTIAPNYILHFQTNVDGYASRQANSYVELRQWSKLQGISTRRERVAGEVVFRDMFVLGQKRLAQMDKYINERLVLKDWRYSPFRLRWFAYPEIGSGRIHYHLPLHIHPDVIYGREHILTSTVSEFNQDRRFGGSLVLQPIQNWTIQILYALKQVDNDVLYNHVVRWNEFAPEPALVRRNGQLVPRKENVPKSRLPLVWGSGDDALV